MITDWGGVTSATLSFHYLFYISINEVKNEFILAARLESSNCCLIRWLSEAQDLFGGSVLSSDKSSEVCNSSDTEIMIKFNFSVNQKLKELKYNRIYHIFKKTTFIAGRRQLKRSITWLLKRLIVMSWIKLWEYCIMLQYSNILQHEIEVDRTNLCVRVAYDVLETICFPPKALDASPPFWEPANGLRLVGV